MKNRAFTLIELLVVVLILGILAAIAVPQYQVAVLKSQYSTLKAKTKAIAEAVNRYQLATGTTPRKFADLDISMAEVSYDPGCTGDNCIFNITFSNGESCSIWGNSNQMVACYLKDYKMGFYFFWNNLKPLSCYARKKFDTTANKVCQQETGRNWTQANYCTSDDTYCTYYY